MVNVVFKLTHSDLNIFVNIRLPIYAVWKNIIHLSQNLWNYYIFKAYEFGIQILFYWNFNFWRLCTKGHQIHSRCNLTCTKTMFTVKPCDKHKKKVLLLQQSWVIGKTKGSYSLSSYPIVFIHCSLNSGKNALFWFRTSF